MHRRDFLLSGLAALPVLASAGMAFAKDYPDRPIRLIVPRQPGGVLDVVARHWGQRVASKLGAIVIDNIGGGGGTIGTATAARAEADGYSLLLGSASDLVLSPLMRKLNFDPLADFQAVSLIGSSVSGIAVHPSVPARTLPELVAYANAHTGELSYGSAGAGTMAHLCGELFKQKATLPKIVHIPYKGGAGGFNDLVSGHIPIMALNISTPTLELHNTGKIRILAAATNRRLSSAPDIPLAADVGYPDWIAELFMGIFVPSATPKPIVEMLATTTQAAVADKAFQQTLVNAGLEPVIGSTPENATKYVNDEVRRWGPILKTVGMSAS